MNHPLPDFLRQMAELPESGKCVKCGQPTAMIWCGACWEPIAERAVEASRQGTWFPSKRVEKPE